MPALKLDKEKSIKQMRQKHVFILFEENDPKCVWTLRMINSFEGVFRVGCFQSMGWQSGVCFGGWEVCFISRREIWVFNIKVWTSQRMFVEVRHGSNEADF